MAKCAVRFDNEKIVRLQVQKEETSLKKLQSCFKTIQQAYLHNMEECKDWIEEDALIEKPEQQYKEGIEKIYESLNFFADYENSYKIY